MTHDVVALLHIEPDGQTLLQAIADADPGLLVLANEAGNVLRLFARDRTLLASLETPSRIDVPGEAIRLLGVAGEPPLPYWWLEIRCPFARDDALPVALSIASSAVSRLGGQVWSTPSPDG